MGKKKNHIDLENDRYGLFMSDNSFNLEIMYGRHYLSNDVKFSINLYRINIIETKSHDLYGQSKTKDKEFFPPVKLNVLLDIEDNNQDSYGSDPNGLVREDSGNLVFGVYIDELKENNTEINRGDIVEFNQSGEKNRYYEVDAANNISDVSSQSIGGFKPYYKKIVAHPIKEDIFYKLKGD